MGSEPSRTREPRVESEPCEGRELQIPSEPWLWREPKLSSEPLALIQHGVPERADSFKSTKGGSVPKQPSCWRVPDALSEPRYLIVRPMESSIAEACECTGFRKRAVNRETPVGYERPKSQNRRSP